MSFCTQKDYSWFIQFLKNDKIFNCIMNEKSGLEIRFAEFFLMQDAF